MVLKQEGQLGFWAPLEAERTVPLASLARAIESVHIH